MPNGSFNIIPFSYDRNRLQYCDSSNDVLGYLEFCADSNDFAVRIHGLFVSAKYRHKGIASALLRYFVGFVRSDYKESDIEVDISPLDPDDTSITLEGLINLYEGCGFAVEATDEGTAWGTYKF